jgi:hypothetical protein
MSCALTTLMVSLIAMTLSAAQPEVATLVVRVEAEGRPLFGAVVRVGTAEARTDARGEARLSVAPGARDVEVSAERRRRATGPASASSCTTPARSRSRRTPGAIVDAAICSRACSSSGASVARGCS